MNEATPVQKQRRGITVTLIVLLVVVIGVAGAFLYKLVQAKDESSALRAQLEDAERQISELQPLAQKARKLPISTRVDRHAINAGYNLMIFNQSRAPLRLSVTVTAVGRSRTFTPVIDGGKLWFVRGLAPNDTVSIASDGYDTEMLTIE